LLEIIPEQKESRGNFSSEKLKPEILWHPGFMSTGEMMAITASPTR